MLPWLNKCSQAGTGCCCWCFLTLLPSLPCLPPPQMDSPTATPAPPPLHLLTPATSSDVSSPCEQIMVRTRSLAVNTADVASATEPECLGPCEPGTSVNLEGIVWQETEDGETPGGLRTQTFTKI